MKLCANCGQELEDEAKICPNCGQKQDDAEPLDSEISDAVEEAEEQYEESGYEEDEFQDTDDFADEKSATKFSILTKVIAFYQRLNIMEKVNKFYQKLNLMEKIDKLYQKITGKDDVPQLWQLGVGGACALGALLFLISAICGSVFSLIGIPASLTFGYFTLKKPKFNSVAMLIPILLFALMFTGMSASFHGFMDVTADTMRSLTSLEEDYRDSEITRDEYRNEQTDLQERFVGASENYVGRFATLSKMDDDDVIDVPAKADVVIFRILIYAMVAIYLFAQLGRLRSTEISMYSMLLISAVTAVYYFVRMFLSNGGGMVLFYLSAFLFMAAWAAFVFFSEKMEENKKSRVLHRLFRVTPAAPSQQNQAIAVSRIAALALAGILALLSVYIIVLLFVTTLKLGDFDETSGYIFRYILITLFQLAALLGGAYMFWRFALKLEKRDDSFLKHYLILGFYTVGLVFVLCSTPVISGWGLFFITLAATAVMLAGAAYLAKSSQVYEYFGSDKYLTQCTVLKKLRIVK